MTPKQENALMVQFEEAILNWLQSESENTTTLAYKLISVIKESIPSNYDNEEKWKTIGLFLTKGDSLHLAKAKWSQGVINTIGPSKCDATEEMINEYKDAVLTLKETGYKMECGLLIKEQNV